MLAQVGGAAQAKQHLERYLELDAGSDGRATRARSSIRSRRSGRGGYRRT